MFGPPPGRQVLDFSAAGSRISVHHVVFGYVNGKKKTTGGREIERENVTKLAKSIILDLVERGRIVDHIQRDTR